jgi:hypothetical protein
MRALPLWCTQQYNSDRLLNTKHWPTDCVSPPPRFRETIPIVHPFLAPRRTDTGTEQGLDSALRYCCREFDSSSKEVVPVLSSGVIPQGSCSIKPPADIPELLLTPTEHDITPGLLKCYKSISCRTLQ